MPPSLPAYEHPYLPLHHTVLDDLTSLSHYGKTPELFSEALRELTDAASELGELNQGASADARGKDILSRIDDAHKSILDADHFGAKGRDLVKAARQREEPKATKRRADKREWMHRRDEEDGEDPEFEAQIGDVKEGVWGGVKAGLEEEREKYFAKSQVERYADIAQYKDFRRTLWHAQHPDGSPMPKEKHWFPSDDNGAAADDSDDEIEVAQENISLKCPLTLVYFVDPVKSKVCPHHFEREAIVQTIGRQGGQCPVAGCSKTMHQGDFEDAPVMVRMVQRDKERKEEEERRAEQARLAGDDESEDEDEDEDMRMRPRVVGEEEEQKEVKKEATQAVRKKADARPKVLDLSSDEDEEEEE